ncbi:MAG: hypothetical protein KDA68_01840 [Planctomycetaceae bacterium]|nr:hypothetical protein [Planctomycetaceae bacterium]
MFDNPNDPKSLLKSLELLCTSGIVGPQNWCGIDRDKLDESEIPEPLKDLYAFSGATLGDNEWCSPFSYEDHLVSFELLTIDDGKLVFAYENQGCWHAGTETGGEDPPVWLREPDGNWNQTPCKSRLSMFLVIMALRELIFGSRYHGSSSKLLGKFRKKKLHVAPLLLDAPFAFGSHSFHIVNANILVMDDSFCATNSTEYFEKFPKLFKDRTLENRPEKEYTSHEEMIRNRSAPWPFREGVARLQSQFHQQRAEYHSAKAAMFRQMLTDLQQNRPTNGNFF